MTSKGCNELQEVVHQAAGVVGGIAHTTGNMENGQLQEDSNSTIDQDNKTGEEKMEVEHVEAIEEKSESQNNEIQQEAPKLENATPCDTEAEQSTSRSLGASTSYDISPTYCNDNESIASSSGQNKIKRSQTNGDSGISMEKSGNSSDEDSSKRRKSKENACSRPKTEEDTEANNAPKFHKLKPKVKKRNYRSERSSGSDATTDSYNDTSSEEWEITQSRKIALITPNSLSPIPVNDDTLRHMREIELSDTADDEEDTTEDELNDWTTTGSEDERREECEESTPACLQKQKPKPNWFIVPEILKRELGNNPLFQQRYYGSLHVVERFKRLYKLKEHQGCVNALNFNRRGNLLASGSDDLAVVIWDWARGKKHQSFDSGHKSNLFQVKWLPFDVENLMATCAYDGQVRLLDVSRGISRKIAQHKAPTHKLAVHPETPHVIISAGEDARVLLIDIRDSKPTKLLEVKHGLSDVELYSVHSNPLKYNEFCVAGKSQSVRIYDRRKPSKPLHTLCPKNLTEDKDAHITCAVYNYNGTEVLASYNDEDIYLFDVGTPEPGDFAHKYQGHRNSATVKGVNFFGPKSEFVISGSDCRNIFIWEKNTEAIVQWMQGDSQGAVNCLEPHPHIPVLATSGLDSDVKIWIPSSDQPPAMNGLKSCVRDNALRSAHGIDGRPDGFDTQILWTLLGHIHHTEGLRNVHVYPSEVRDWSDYDDDDDEDSSDHSDSQSEWNGIGRLQCPPS